MGPAHRIVVDEPVRNEGLRELAKWFGQHVASDETWVAVGRGAAAEVLSRIWTVQRLVVHMCAAPAVPDRTDLRVWLTVQAQEVTAVRILQLNEPHSAGALGRLVLEEVVVVCSGHPAHDSGCRLLAAVQGLEEVGVPVVVW